MARAMLNTPVERRTQAAFKPSTSLSTGVPMKSTIAYVLGLALSATAFAAPAAAADADAAPAKPVKKAVHAKKAHKKAMKKKATKAEPKTDDAAPAPAAE